MTAPSGPQPEHPFDVHFHYVQQCSHHLAHPPHTWRTTGSDDWLGCNGLSDREHEGKQYRPQPVLPMGLADDMVSIKAALGVVIGKLDDILDWQNDLEDFAESHFGIKIPHDAVVEPERTET